MKSLSFIMELMKELRDYLPRIGLVGLVLGVANFALGVWSSLGVSLVMQVVISFLIGVPLVLIALQRERIFPASWSPALGKGMLGLAFFIVGLLGTEGQLLAEHLFFSSGNYAPFSVINVGLFNGLLTLVLGFAFIEIVPPKNTGLTMAAPAAMVQSEGSRIPIRHDDGTHLYEAKQISYFEAYDNYSFLHDTEGNKKLCHASLATLERQLPTVFSRVHRKYLVNRSNIVRVAPHTKGRFMLEFSGAGQQVVSGASYAEAVKILIEAP